MIILLLLFPLLLGLTPVTPDMLLPAVFLKKFYFHFYSVLLLLFFINSPHCGPQPTSLTHTLGVAETLPKFASLRHCHDATVTRLYIPHIIFLTIVSSNFFIPPPKHPMANGMTSTV